VIPGLSSLFLGSSNLVNWTDINATGGSGETNTVTVPFTTTLFAAMSPTSGTAGIFYVKNGGSATTYSGGVSVTSGDTIAWGLQTKTTYNGVITISKTGSVFVDSFNANVTV